MKSIGRKITDGTLWILVETWGYQIMLFLLFVILARLLGPSAIGLAALAMSAPIIFAVPVTKGIPEAIIQRPELTELHLDSAFWVLVGLGACLAAIVWLSSDLVAAAFGEPTLASLVRFTCIVIVAQSVSAVPIAVLKRELDFRLLTLRTLIGTLCGGIVGISLALAGFGVWSIIWMQITKALLEPVILLLAGRWRPGFRFSLQHCRDLQGFATPIVGFSLWQYVNDEIPKVMLGAVLGPSAVGIYMVARRPVDLLCNAILGPISGVVMPAVSRLQNDKAKLDLFFEKSLRGAMLVGFPAFVGLAAIAPDIIPLVFGEQWVSSIGPAQIILLIGLVRSVDSVCAGTILALGQSRPILILNIIYSFMAAAAILFTSQISIDATMVAIVACNAVLVLPLLYYVHRLAAIDVLKPLQILPRLVLATLAMLIAVETWRHLVGDTGSAVVVLSTIAVGGLTYVAPVILLLRPELISARDLIVKARG